MSRRLVPLLLVCWLLAALAWAWQQDDEDATPTSLGADAPPAAALGRGPLLGSGNGRSEAEIADVSIPDAVAADIDRAKEAAARERAWTWIEAGEGRLTRVLFAMSPRWRNSSAAVWFTRGRYPPLPDLQIYARLMRFLSFSRARLLRHKPEVLSAFDAAFARGHQDERRMGGVLAALGVLGFHARDQMASLAVIGQDADRSQTIRVLAAEVLLLIDPQAPLTQTATAAVLRASGTGDMATSWLLRRIEARGHAMAALVPALLQVNERTRHHGFWARAALRALVAVDPTNPLVRRRLARELNTSDRWVAKFARVALLSASDDDVLEIVRDLAGMARLIGIETLSARGVDKPVLSALLPPVLLDERADARAAGVRALGRIGTEQGPFLAVIERLLKARDEARWLTAVHALGALSTVPGNKDAAIQRLFSLARSPNERVRVTAVQSILMHRTRTGTKLDLLGALLRDSAKAVREEAVDGLGELLAEDERARAQLKIALGDTDADIRKLATYWLAEEDGDDDDSGDGDR